MFCRSIVEVTVTQLLVDPLADARHVLLTEQQRLLHRETTAVLKDKNSTVTVIFLLRNTLDDGNLPAFLESRLFFLSGFRQKILHNVIRGVSEDNALAVIVTDGFSCHGDRDERPVDF